MKELLENSIKENKENRRKIYDNAFKTIDNIEPFENIEYLKLINAIYERI